jgi:hypothetical protein
VSWAPADDGRDRHYTWAVAPDPVDPDRWWISASTGPYAAHGRGSAEARLYRWSGDGPWEALTGELDSMPYALLAVDGLLLAGYKDGRLAESRDGGDSWRDVELEGDAIPSVVALAALA